MTVGRAVMGAAVSRDGYIADDQDGVGPLFDRYGNGDVAGRSREAPRSPTAHAPPPTS